MVVMIISVSGLSSSVCHTPGERSAIRLGDAGIRLVTVTSVDLPETVFVTRALELIGRLGWAILSPSALNSWVAFPR